MLCKHFRDVDKHGRCTTTNCPYSHDKKRFRKADGTLAQKPLRAAGAAAQSGGAALDEGGDDECEECGGWDAPVGLWSGSVIEIVTPKQNLCGLNNKSSGDIPKQKGDISRLSDLPKDVWSKVPNNLGFTASCDWGRNRIFVYKAEELRV